MATDGQTYVIKGPDPSIVFAEHAAYELAALAGVPVPEHALCMLPGAGGSVFFASRKKRIRIDPEVMWSSGMVENRDMLASTAAFDIWIANTDRNLGNIVAEPVGFDGQVRWFAIDFERAEALRGRDDLFTIMAMDPKRMYPQEQLGAFCREQIIPLPTCDRIAAASESVAQILDRWHSDLTLPRIDWSDRIASILSRRAERIHHLVQEAWS